MSLSLLREGASAFRVPRLDRDDYAVGFLIRTLYEAKGIVSGWGHHYSFCNEKNILSQLDREVDHLLRDYFGAYRDTIKRVDPRGRRHLIGIPLLAEFASHPFLWKTPKIAEASLSSLPGTTVPVLATS